MSIVRRHRPGTGPADIAPAPGDTVLAPVDGTVVPLAEVDDEVFSSGMLGPGVGIAPTSGEVRAPVGGTLTTAFPTGHAFGIVAEDGTQVMVHIGLDTVRLQGRGFTPRVEKGARVEAGDLLATVDLATVRDAGYDPVTIVVVLGGTDLTAVTPTGAATVSAGDPVLLLRH